MPGCFACLKRRESDSYSPVKGSNRQPPSSNLCDDDQTDLGQSQTLVNFSSAKQHQQHQLPHNASAAEDLNSLDTLTNIAADFVAKGDQSVGEQASRINFLLTDDTTSECVSYPEAGQPSLLTVDEARAGKPKQQHLKLASGDHKAIEKEMQGLENLVNRLEAVTSRLERAAGGDMPTGAPPPPTCIVGAGAAKPWVAAYGAFVDGVVAEFLALCTKIGGEVSTAGDLVSKAFEAQRRFIASASGRSCPSASDLPKYLKPQADAIGAVVTFKDSKRASKQFDHLSALAEGIAMVGWVAITPTPIGFVKDAVESAQFYTNRVLKEHKDKNPDHVNWARTWIRIGNDLAAYVKEHHTTGLAWTAGGPTMQLAGGPPPPPPSGGAPPPPPPPPPPPADLGAPAKPSGEDARAALFASLNRGDDVTKGLRKVTDDMKTHKNPDLRKTAVVAASSGSKPPPISPKPGRKAPVKPPVLELVDNKWMVENHVGNKNIVIADTQRKQTVYIFKCTDCTVQVKGKINSIVIDSCKKLALAFDDLISALDVVNCQSVQAQVMGCVQTVNIDKTDGFQIYLSKDSLHADLVTAKSSEMNVLIPTEDGDFTEFPLPEQYKTNWSKEGGLKTVVADN